MTVKAIDRAGFPQAVPAATPEPRPPVIRVSAVSHKFGDPSSGFYLQALGEISLSIAPGELTCLIGPSGCGKSTLLNIIGGMVKPTTGDVFVDDQPVRSVQPKKIAFIFQESTLFPWNTVTENLRIALEFQGVAKRERGDRVADALNAVGMAEFANLYPGQLSGGMKQRVALARALCLETDIMLMDEPFAALDEQTRMVLGEDLSVLLAKTGKTIVFVTHSLSEAVFLSDRIYVITARPGRIKAVVEVEKEHPRTPDFMTSDQLNDIRGELYRQLHDEIRRTIDSMRVVS